MTVLSLHTSSLTNSRGCKRTNEDNPCNVMTKAAPSLQFSKNLGVGQGLNPLTSCTTTKVLTNELTMWLLNATTDREGGSDFLYCMVTKPIPLSFSPFPDKNKLSLKIVYCSSWFRNTTHHGLRFGLHVPSGPSS